MSHIDAKYLCDGEISTIKVILFNEIITKLQKFMISCGKYATSTPMLIKYYIFQIVSERHILLQSIKLTMNIIYIQESQFFQINGIPYSKLNGF